MYSPSQVICLDTVSFICVSNTRIPVPVYFILDTTGPWYITNWFNLSRNLNNAIVPFVRVNVPTGPAWSINVRWIVAFITAALRIPYRGVKEESRADVWKDSFDASFPSEWGRVYTFFFLFVFFPLHLRTLISRNTYRLLKTLAGPFRSKTWGALRAVLARKRNCDGNILFEIALTFKAIWFDGQWKHWRPVKSHQNLQDGTFHMQLTSLAQRGEGHSTKTHRWSLMFDTTTTTK